MNSNDVELDNFYSTAFKAIYYPRESIPKDHLPYGLISDHSKYTNQQAAIKKDEWALEIYEDCLKYLNDDEKTDPESWNDDFVLFTNLQIAFYNKADLIREEEEFDKLVNYTSKHIRNLRSYVARNAHLFLECLTYCLDDDKLSNLCYKIITNLLACTGSEKSIYREPSKKNLKNLTNKSAKLFNQEILWILLEHTQNKNKRISSSAGDSTLEYFTNVSQKDLEVLDMPKFANYVESSLNSGNIDVKKSIKQLIIKLPKALSELKLKEFIKESENKKATRKVLKKEHSPNL
ncbi:conserved hypothetical protein [Theileria orientalis strain Shintoku]|uniref:Uncharacterized protein n=1 Tax=Theileria orientalis strain Shintoku TaxID=869250 RepID=J4C317_THEOR|nr:conserved hypothetical protein [Theileria orientalis strain Shintoku]PVC52499.1 hypothetical protein MACL_00000781 [Theileria orientalis]BAM39661.1 conserved hypothetical protein [Theileria orientalis strain Shintoku]|eukprot:XP_009689962.1 conserved hypothetical protein [Theileria orientalis strain Shintoku]